MLQNIKNSAKILSWRRSLALVSLTLLMMLAPVGAANALGSQQNPQSGSVGIEGRISAPPPTQAATISTPSNGQVFTDTPITVAGLCKSGYIVKIFSNNVFVGSATCNGSYSLKVDLFSGTNELVAIVYDSLDQAGPSSNQVTVIFNDAQFAQFGTRVSLTSNYARRGANPGVQLDWPIIVSGGNGPYALAVDWGDSTGTKLSTLSFPGTTNISHTYSVAGVYTIVVKATDSNGTNAYLQLVGVANGNAKTSIAQGASSGTVVYASGPLDKYLWLIFILLFPLLAVAFWLGSRHELYVVRRRIERSRSVE